MTDAKDTKCDRWTVGERRWVMSNQTYSKFGYNPSSHYKSGGIHKGRYRRGGSRGIKVLNPHGTLPHGVAILDAHFFNDVSAGGKLGVKSGSWLRVT